MNNLTVVSEASRPCDSPRIAIVAPSLQILGGQGVQARSLQCALQDEGVEVRFLAVNPDFPRLLGWLRQLPFLRTLINQLLYIPRLIELRHVDVVHIFSASYWSFLLAPVPAIIAARLLGKSVVLNYHSGEAKDHLENWGMLVHPWLRRVDKLVVPSEYLKSVFAEYGYESEVVKNIVDISHFKFREREALKPLLFSNRNLEPHYCVSNTILAFSRLQQKWPKARLTIAGYGGEEQKLKRIVYEMRLSNVEFVGRVETRHMAEYYNNSDIWVNSSVIDNQPISILEAFSAGLAVVSTPPGDIPAMLEHGRLGVLVPCNDPAALAEAIGGILKDQIAAKARISAARNAVEKYTWPHIASQWLNLYTNT